MNASLASHLDDITAPLAAGPAPPAPGAAFQSGEEVVHDTGLPVASLWPTGRVLRNRYRIGRVLESGGMATLYEATQLDLVRRVAIKVPTAKCAADSPCARRFEREARTLAGLQHPHIVSVYELGRSEEGVTFMAMEFVEGITLRAHLLAEGSLPWRVAAMFAAQLADALEVAHTTGVVHGDVSAANVLLARRGDTLVSKLIDFGAARRIGQGDLPHLTYGTTRYVAPELFGGEAPHIASDLFALGAVLKEMLGEGTLAASPQSLQQLVASMLDADPQGRPESAAEVVQQLRDLLDAQPATAPRYVATPIHADPYDAARRLQRAVPAPTHVRTRWMAAGLVGGTALCALVAYLHYRTPVAAVREISAAVVPQVAPARAVAAPASKVALFVPPSPEAGRIRAQPTAAPVVVAAERRKRVPVPVQMPKSAAVLPVEAAANYEVLRDESLEQAEIVASLDRWFIARNRNVAGERVPVMAMRVGKPSIAFDPSGTSASVTYRKRLVYSRSSRVEQSIIEEQVFFAKLDGAWQLVSPDRD